MMECYSLPRDSAQLPAVPRTVALGLFDGIHNGHRAVIAAALQAGNGACAVYTFPPAEMDTKPGLQMLCTVEEQHEIMEKAGVTEWLEADFSTVRSFSPAAFVHEVLKEQLHAVRVVCGYNYRFGKDGAGTADTLTTLCRQQGIAVTVVPPVEQDGTPVSSTRIREAIMRGDTDTARRMMGRGFSFRLPVIHGRQIGRCWGFPTINQQIPTQMILPRFGVYASAAEVDGCSYPAVTNIGIRPTVGGDSPLAETYIEGFDGDLYGRTVAVYPLYFLREEKRFASAEDLRQQIKLDAQSATEPFRRPVSDKPKAIFLDFDDTLHRRDEAFRPAVRAFLQYHYPGLPATEYDQRVAEMIDYNGHGYRMTCTYPEYIHHFLHRWEGCHDPDDDRAVRRFMLSFAAHCHPEPDTLSTLTALRKRGYLLGIITNGNSILQNAKIDLSGIRPYVDMTVVGGDEGLQKPDPRLFRRAACRFGLRCEDCLYVGDNPTNDIEGAVSAGMKPIWIDFGFPPDHPCYDVPVDPAVPTVHCLADLLDFL